MLFLFTITSSSNCIWCSFSHSFTFQAAGYSFWGGWAVWPLQSVCIFSVRSRGGVASGCPARCVAVLASLHLFCQQRRRQSSLENVLMINDSGSCAENASAGSTLRGVVFADGWVVGGMIGPDSHVHPCSVFAWLWLCDGGCALPHRGHYPVLVSAGLHLGGQRDSDMSARRAAADGWTPTSLSRWVTLSSVCVVLTLLLLNYGLLGLWGRNVCILLLFGLYL